MPAAATSVSANYCSCGCGGVANEGRRYIWGHQPLPGRPGKSVAEHFADKSIQSEGCWKWLGNVDRYGRGMFRYKGRTVTAPRIAWLLYRGEFPELQVLHTCDNPNCVNPEHLFLGTQKDNMQDCLAKGRFVATKGEANANAVLREKDVRNIRKLANKGLRVVAIASKLQLTYNAVYFVARGISWRHVK